MREPVKGKSEAGRRREQRARRTRDRIVQAATRLFLERGYVATTVDAIAREAGVAAATVYQAFGTKQAILAAGLDFTIAGDAEPVAVLEREWVRALRGESDRVRRLRLVIQNTTEIAARTAPIKAVMRDAAAVEPSIRDLIHQDHQGRYKTQQALVEVIVGESAGHSGSRGPSAVDTFFTLVNSDTFRLFVGHLGWTIQQWREWLFQLLSHELFDRDGGSQANASPPL
jgi:AcrR family transcriptional regulator